jgi:tetratricopeptide (TPR) repeat protein
MESSEKLFYAVAALLQFVGSNFTGPDVSTDSSISIKFLEDPVSILKVDGIDQIDPNFKNVEYLCSAKVILDDLVKTQYDDFATNLWYLRSLVIHQKVLEDNSNTIYEKILKVVEKLKDQLTAFPKERHRFLVHVEIVQSLMNYKRVNQIESLLEELKTDFKIQTIVEGILGVRTKFQQKPLPQLHLTVKFDNEIFSTPSKDTHKTTKLTEILILDDEVRLEQIKFCSDEYNQVQELNSAIQTLLLLFIKFLEISQPKDKLADEEIRPYITTLLSQQNGPWIVRLHTLLTNIKLEANHRRTVERSLRQCEELVTIFKNGDAGEFKNRSSYIFSSLLIPRHEVESQLANLMVSLGLIKGALDVYLKLQQWEEVINCYTILQLRHKAAEVINQELAKKPTVKLYCMLGDATDDVACYEKAWEFSNFTSGRAQRHWGNYYFARKEYSEAIPHLQKSLEINSLQEVTWLRLGYSALSLENWELAAHAYVRYTQLETNGFESWNNLAKCYIKMNDKKRAHKILQESLKVRIFTLILTWFLY